MKKVFIAAAMTMAFGSASAADIVDMGAGANVLFTGAGNDRITSTGTDTIDAGDGDDLIFMSGDGYAKVAGGAGFDRLILAPISSTTAISRNQEQLRIDQRVIDFNDGLDRIEITDNAAVSRISSVNGASWGATDMFLSAAGLVDVRGATLIGAESQVSITAAGVQGTLNTELAELTVVNRGTAGFNDIVVREADSLNVGGAGLVAAHGAIDVALAGREALFTLQAGVIATGSGGAIAIVADDIDFLSGNDQVSGTGALVLHATSANQNYHIGGAAQTPYGFEYSSLGATGNFEFGLGDLSALKTGFSSVTLG